MVTAGVAFGSSEADRPTGALAAAPVASARGADARLCRSARPLTREEGRFQAALHTHRVFGLPTSRRHIERDLAHPYRPPGPLVDPLGPLNKREYEYMRDRNTIERGVDDALAFLRRDPQLNGGLSVEDDYPRGAYLRIRVTRPIDRAAMRQAVLAPLRFRQVRFSQVELSAAANDRAGFDALRRKGIEVVTALPLLDRNRVRFDVRTDRADAERIVRRRYGPIVAAVRVLPPPTTKPVCTGVTSVAIASGSLTLSYLTNSEYVLDHVYVDERADEVRVAIIEQAPTGFVTDMAATRTATVDVELADREIVDARSGDPIRIAGEPPAPASTRVGSLAQAGPAVTGNAMFWGTVGKGGALLVKRHEGGRADTVHRILPSTRPNGERSFGGVPGGSARRRTGSPTRSTTELARLEVTSCRASSW